MIEYLFIGLILILPFQFALNIGENVDLVITRVLIPVIFLMWLVRGFSQKKIWLSDKPETWLILVFIGFSAISLVFARDWELGIRKMLYLITIFPIYFVAADLLRRNDFRIKALGAMMISGVMAALSGIVQSSLPFFVGIDKTVEIWREMAPFFLGNSFGEIVAGNPSWLVNISGSTWMRAFGVFPDPHNFAFFISLIFFISLGYVFYEKRGLLRFLAVVGVVITILAVAFSFSRGAYVGVLAGMIFFSAVLLYRSGYLARTVGVTGIAVIILVFALPGTVSQRLSSVFNLKEGSNLERLKNWQEASEITIDYPLSGVGLGGYSVAIDPTSPIRSSIYAHNLFLDIASETGILNGLVFGGLLLVSVWENMRNKDAISLGAAGALVYFFIHGIFDTPLWSPQVMTIFLLVIALGMHKGDDGKTEQLPV